ncbi:MAG TPA: hypothetical protein VN829_12480 [Dongiaceae bacterium]|nr:hypothetical protein [Dongiaceae bacterium]
MVPSLAVPVSLEFGVKPSGTLEVCSRPLVNDENRLDTKPAIPIRRECATKLVQMRVGGLLALTLRKRAKEQHMRVGA